MVLTLRALWSERGAMLFVRWAMASALLLALTTVLCGLRLDSPAECRAVFWHETAWPQKCVAIEPSLSATGDERQWISERTCAITNGMAPALLLEDASFMSAVLEARGAPCQLEWEPYVTSSPLNNQAIVDRFQSLHRRRCGSSCQGVALQIAEREWNRMRRLQMERLSTGILAWESKPFLLRDGGGAATTGSMVWVGWTLFTLGRWRRRVRPIIVEFKMSAVVLDGQPILLESLRDARLEGNRMVFVTDSKRFVSRELSSDTIVEIDGWLQRVERREGGNGDSTSLAAMRGLMNQWKKAQS